MKQNTDMRARRTDGRLAVSRRDNLLAACATAMIAALLGLGPIRVSAATNAVPATVSLADISQAMAGVETVYTRFVQERHLSLFDEPLRSEGFLCFQKPGRIRWETTRPYKSILVSDGAGVAQFEWTDEKWKRLELGLGGALQNVVSQIASVMEGRYAADRGAYAASVTNAADARVVMLVPRNETMRKMMQAIEVHLAPDLSATRRVVLRENGGDYTDIRFEAQKIGAVFPPATFDRTAPLDGEQLDRAVSTSPPSGAAKPASP